MPFELGRDDRKLLATIGIVFAVLIALTALLSPPSDKETGVPTTYSATSGGAKGAYLLLKESGYQVQRWEQSPAELPEAPDGVLLILAEPVVPPREEETFALHRFLTNGGRVLVAGGSNRYVPEFDGEPDLKAIEWKDFRAQLPSALTRGAPQVRMAPRFHWKLRHSGHLALYAGDDGVVAVTYPVGKGKVIWWASATPLTNAGISQSHNLEFLLDSIGDPRSVRVLWDEYFHGQQRSLWTLVRSTPVPFALAQLGVFALAVVMTYSRRNGPVRMPREESRLSTLEFVETLGALYRKADAGSVAVDIALARLRFDASRRFGLPVRSSIDDIAQATAGRLGLTDSTFLETLKAAESASHDPELSHTQALAIVRKLYAQAGLLTKNPKRKETKDGDSKPAGGARPL